MDNDILMHIMVFLPWQHIIQPISKQWLRISKNKILWDGKIVTRLLNNYRECITHLNINYTGKKLKYPNLISLNLQNSRINERKISLPDTIIYLNLSNTGIHHIPELPKHLKYLNLSRIKYLKNNRTPKNCKEINYHKDIMYDLPSTLEYLIMVNMNLTKLKLLPKNLLHLDVSFNYLTHIGDLPTLTSLNVSYNNIADITNLPEFANTEGSQGIIELN